jgi:hypothetical protein
LRRIFRSPREQLSIALVHLGPDLPQQGKGILAIRPRHALGHRRPRRQLHELSVEQPDPRIRIKRGGREQHRQRRRLSSAGLTAE